MDRQQNLFDRGEDPPTPAHSDHDTSLQAAESVAPHVTRLAEEVLQYIKRCGIDGATCDEIERALVMRHQTASARVRELALAGRIKKSDLRRKTRSGRPAVVWVKT